MGRVRVSKGLKFESQLKERVESEKVNLHLIFFSKYIIFYIVLLIQRSDSIKAHLNVLMPNIISGIGQILIYVGNKFIM